MQIRWLSVLHLYGHDAQRPDINLFAYKKSAMLNREHKSEVPVSHTVMFSTDDLWRHPVGRADHRVSLLVALDVRAEAEVGDLDAAVDAQEDVVRLDVSVEDALVVEVVDALQNLEK